MRSLRRFFRRKQKPFLVLSLLSLLNLLIPHQAEAAQPVRQNVGAQSRLTASVVRLQRDIRVDAREAQQPRPTLPVVPPVKAKRTVQVKATAYTSSVGETDSDPWTTASGARAGDGIIAANSLKFGTRVRFPDHYGDKVFVVQDRMNSRYGSNYVDIWMPSKHVAKQWGVRSVRMEIL